MEPTEAVFNFPVMVCDDMQEVLSTHLSFGVLGVRHPSRQCLTA
jgi:hypothetical protein